ncbi:hypothetical protein [Bacillus salacetis]|uniref:hypothetical protein n=1 Tax=Bacillus salacetis TaxID=2315464 RepID=UPI0014448147|nr:hypothetical protein [Bacillus salacetis]
MNDWVIFIGILCLAVITEFAVLTYTKDPKRKILFSTAIWAGVMVIFILLWI